MHRPGAHCLVGARKRGNARGAKEAGHPRQDGVNGQPEELLVLAEAGGLLRGGTSRMNREIHVRNCGGLGVKSPGLPGISLGFRRLGDRVLAPGHHPSCASYRYLAIRPAFASSSVGRVYSNLVSRKSHMRRVHGDDRRTPFGCIPENRRTSRVMCAWSE
jgi:hypothetical protein